MMLADLKKICFQRTDQLYHKYLQIPAHPALKLQEALAYAVLNGGKRIRPLLVYAAGSAVGATLENLDAPASAVELIHAYSLIHDDLPAMDNADYRRGKPSCHKKYGEALAILAGDALQPLAFQIIAEHPCALKAEQRLKMISLLSEASGGLGMAAGQALDISGKISTLEDLTTLYRLKTGALLSASIKMGMAASMQYNTSLDEYADCLGLAFQIQDDILDIESNFETSGKPQGIDVMNAKVTYPQLLGLENARLKVSELLDTAIAALDDLGAKGDALRELGQHLLHRKQ